MLEISALLGQVSRAKGAACLETTPSAKIQLLRLSVKSLAFQGSRCVVSELLQHEVEVLCIFSSVFFPPHGY